MTEHLYIVTATTKTVEGYAGRITEMPSVSTVFADVAAFRPIGDDSPFCIRAVMDEDQIDHLKEAAEERGYVVEPDYKLTHDL